MNFKELMQNLSILPNAFFASYKCIKGKNMVVLYKRGFRQT